MDGKIWTQNVINIGSPPPSGDEPDMSSIGTLFFADSFEYASMSAMSAGNGSNLVTIPLPSQISNGTDPGPDHSLIAGRTGGKAIRSSYTGEDQSGADWETWPEGQSFVGIKTHYFQYWARVTFAGTRVGNDPTIKWFETWILNGSDRTQFNTRYRIPLSVVYSDSHSPVWEALWSTEVNGDVTGHIADADSQQPIGPYPGDVFDGQWHRFTYAVRAHASTSNKNGFQRMWVDGTKIIDLCQAQVEITPPGGCKVWCTQNEVDRMTANTNVDHVRWGGVQTSPAGSGPFTLDIDDFLWRVE